MFLESLQAFNTPGKLKNFRHESAQIAAQKKALTQLKTLQDLALLAQELGVTRHTSPPRRQSCRPRHWREAVQSRRGELLRQLVSPKKRGNVPAQRELRGAAAAEAAVRGRLPHSSREGAPRRERGQQEEEAAPGRPA